MKILLLLIALAPSTLFAQNLVLNPSFEDTAQNCLIVNYPICKDWYNPNGLTADYFSEISNSLECWGSAYQVPNTALGFQIPYDDNAFIGLVLYEGSQSNVKEFAQGFLNQPMIHGEVYNISLYISLSDTCPFKICDLQFFLTDTLIYNSSFLLDLPSEPINIDISNVNSDEWCQVGANYEAIGGEKYIYIGNNTPNPEIFCAQYLPNRWENLNSAYYFIDNISVTSNTTNTTNTNLFTKPKLFPNPVSSFLYIENLSSSDYFIYNTLSECVKYGVFESNNKIDLSLMPEGMYFLKLNEYSTYKFFINR